ncbi:SdrD B-like domain-containing protein [Lentzea californiensis]|uniref:SdrD B-like domain-containing protein n=1 Tax=Lentzea californiensis TaxID=438851 RepID=UPI0021649136|nr:SdrD B-like domain-containing protein [Lentzea californiensis]MCR3746880.1 LPXTG-motif cell wall anchor domain-containing protein [Lentzea californiensis]
MRKTFAVATTAALVLTATGAPALAQDETISITGRVFLDHNGNGTFDAGDGVQIGGPGVRITDADGRTTDLPVGPSGRYRVQKLLKAAYEVETLNVVNYTTTKSSFTTSETVTDGDFALVGQVAKGVAYVDANGDGTKQADEKPVTEGLRVTGNAKDGSPVDVTRTAGADGAYRFDLPLGGYTLTAPLLNSEGLVLGKPNAVTDIDWATGARELTGQTEQVDLRYITAAANLTVKGALSPAKATYVVGEEITAKVQLINTGNAPVLPMIGLGGFHAKLIRYSDSLAAETDTQFELKRKIVPGETLEIELTFTPTGTDFAGLHLVVFDTMRGLKDVDSSDNMLQIATKVVEKGAETTTPVTSTTTAAPATTTTTPAVAQAGNKAGLASTGASPLGFLAIGALLLAAGTSAFFLARRRRS